MAKTVIAFDTETHRIGPGALAPKIVCASFAWRDQDGNMQKRLFSRVDDGILPFLERMLDGEFRIVGHNLTFDLHVLIEEWPHLEELIWDRAYDGDLTDTMIREMLLDLSTVGSIGMLPMPDGRKKKVLYSMADIAARQLGLDLSGDKTGPDAWRLNYDKLDGLPSEKFPADAARYALDDAVHTLQIFEDQEDRVETESRHASLSTDWFHTMSTFALYHITREGMLIDPNEFRKIVAMLDDELSEDRLLPLINSGILRPSTPSRPYGGQIKKATKLLSDWLGIEPEDVEWGRVDDGLRLALEDCGVKFTEPKESSIDTGNLKKRVAMLFLALTSPGVFEDVKEELLEVARVGTQEDVLAMVEDLGANVPRTDTGGISTDREAISAIADIDTPEPGHTESPMACFQRRQALRQLVSVEVPRMMWQGEPAEKVHFNFAVLKETARTSSYASDLYPSANGQNVDPRARPVFVAPEGYLLCSVDFATLELVTTAQTTYDLFGESRHRDILNMGWDAHASLGSKLALDLSHEFPAWVDEAGINRSSKEDVYRFFLSFKGHQDEKKNKFFKFWRKLAKPVGLGYPSGLGPWTMVGHALKDPYNVDICAMAEEKFRENPDQFEPCRYVRYYAKKLYGMGSENFKWNRPLLGLSLAAKIRGVWLEDYPEMVPYFDWVTKQKDERNPRLNVTEDDEDGKEGLCYVTPMGMFRAGATYTAVCNGKALQSPAAEGFKFAFTDLVRATRDRRLDSVLYKRAKVVDEIHDEVLTYQLLGDLLPEQVKEKQRIMEEGMARVITDVKVRTEAVLMRRWYKQAEPVFDAAGNLTVWEPK